jgi:RecA-family ATPase
MSDRLWPLYAEHELSALPEPEWLVDRMLTDGLTVMYGPPKAGKTFAALSMALHVGAGIDWFGANVKAGPVLYVSGEGQGGLHKRIEGWKKATGRTSSDLYVIPFPVKLGNPNHVAALIEDAKSVRARLVIIDTLARSMAGMDENSAQDMGNVIAGLGYLKAQTNVGILILHHSGVEGSRPRGSSALFGAADTLMKVEGDGKYLTLYCEGMKDAAPFRTRRFELTQAAQSLALAERAPSGMTAI